MIDMYAGREVIASRWAVGSARRQNTFHQLATIAMSRAITLHGFSLWVVNPAQPHWFLNSSKLFSQSPLSR